VPSTDLPRFNASPVGAADHGSALAAELASGLAPKGRPVTLAVPPLVPIVASVCLKQNLMGAGGLQTQIKNRVGLFLPALLNYGGPSFPPELGPFDF
jgi:hypothetical protein